MARTRTISLIEIEINKAETDLVKARERCDALSAKLHELQEQKQTAETKQVMDAFLDVQRR